MPKDFPMNLCLKSKYTFLCGRFPQIDGPKRNETENPRAPNGSTVSDSEGKRHASEGRKGKRPCTNPCHTLDAASLAVNFLLLSVLSIPMFPNQMLQFPYRFQESVSMPPSFPRMKMLQAISSIAGRERDRITKLTPAIVMTMPFRSKIFEIQLYNKESGRPRSNA